MAEADFLVIGGGLAGCAIAYGLARAGHGIVWVQGKGLGLPPYQRWTRLSSDAWPAFAAAIEAESGVAIDRAMVADAMRRVASKDLALSDSDIRDSLDPWQSIERRDLPGGPAPGQVHAMAEMLADDARRHADGVSAKRDALALAADDMEERLAALTKQP